MKEYILVLDSETANSIVDENGKVNLDYSMFYDLGLIVGDLNGNIETVKSFVNEDIFTNEGMMSSAYFKDKMPMYIEDIENGKREMKPFNYIKNYVYYTMKKYNITKVYAYNIRFDFNALGQTTRYLSKSKNRYFFRYGTQPYDIMILGRELAKQEEYKQFCSANGYTTKNGRPQIKVETLVRFLYDENFNEDHTGYEDALNEYQILCDLTKMFPNVDCQLWK